MKVGILFKKEETREVEVTMCEGAGYEDLASAVKAEREKLGDDWEFETWWRVGKDEGQ